MKLDKYMDNKMEMFSIRVDKKDIVLLKKVTEKQGVSMSAVLRAMIRKYIDENKNLS